MLDALFGMHCSPYPTSSLLESLAVASVMMSKKATQLHQRLVARFERAAEMLDEAQKARPERFARCQRAEENRRRVSIETDTRSL